MKIEVICKQCNQPFMKYPSQISKTKGSNFCTRNCAAIHNNKAFPKKSLFEQHKCMTCNKTISLNRQKCKQCYQDYLESKKHQTLSELIGKGPARYSEVRRRARLVYMRSDKPQHCIQCGFDAHFEVSHIKPISEFSGDTPVSIVNDLSNLQALCPNCHWLHDHPIKPDDD